MQRQVTKLRSFEGILSDVKEIVPSWKLSSFRNEKVTVSFLSRRFSLLSSSTSSPLQVKSAFSSLTKSCENSNVALRALSTFTNQTNNSYNHGLCHKRFMSSSSDNQSQDDTTSSKVDQKKKTRQSKPKEGASDKTDGVARSKLNNLLQSIIKDTAERKTKDANEGKKEASTPKVDLAIPSKPLEKRRKKKIQEALSEPEAEGEVVLGKRVLSAVKKVAESMGGDVEQIQSELVQKLKSQSMQKVKLSDLVQGMQVDTLKTKQQPTETQGQESYSRSDRVRQAMQERPPRRSAPYGRRGQEGEDGGEVRRHPRRDQQRFSRREDFQQEEESGRFQTFERVNLFSAPPLRIFSEQATQAKIQAEESQTESSTPKTTWDVLEAKELKLTVTHPPANGFEEMIQWTEQKKLWTFPIDNEQGMEEEAQYSFEDHVFLETQIEPWCPTEGPVRTFMELVCVGLAKNPYLTVPEKRDYLEWYYEYFKEKNVILKSLGSAQIKDIGDISHTIKQVSAS